MLVLPLYRENSMATIKQRFAAGLLSLSAAGFVGILTSEGYTDNTVIPVRGDVPTNGFGNTQGVKPGDKTNPVRAIVAAHDHIERTEKLFRASIPDVPLYQEEYDVYLDWIYQYGIGKWHTSSMRSNLLSGNYAVACDSLLSYRYMTSRKPLPGYTPYRWDSKKRPIEWRFDCSTPGNKTCYGVWTRQLARHAKCMAVQ